MFLVCLGSAQYLHKLPQIENNIKIEASISLRRRDEEVKVHREPDCFQFGGVYGVSLRDIESLAQQIDGDFLPSAAENRL